MSLYREDIIELYRNPLNMREIKQPTVTHSGANMLCGDRVRVYLKLTDGIVEDASFHGEGCAISIACASLLTEEIKGKSTTDVLCMQTNDVLDMLSLQLGPSRIKCAVLVLETIQEGLKKKNPGD